MIINGKHDLKRRPSKVNAEWVPLHVLIPIILNTLFVLIDISDFFLAGSRRRVASVRPRHTRMTQWRPIAPGTEIATKLKTLGSCCNYELTYCDIFPLSPSLLPTLLP